MSDVKVVIMAGGGGTRLWPVSRNAKSKQTLNLIGRGSLLRQTYRRLRRGFKPRDMYVTVGLTDALMVRRQLPEIPKANFSIEPARRDTAPAIGLAAITIMKTQPRAVMVVVSSDHYINGDRQYLKTLKAAAAYVARQPEKTAVIGVKPTYAETGYGYIQFGTSMGTSNGVPVFRVKRFLEKPNLARAKQFISRPDYVWNSGMFVWRADNLLGLFQRYAPALWRGLHSLQRVINTKQYPTALKRDYPRLQKISIDYAVMEKAKDVVVFPATFGWTDVGHWRSVKEILAPELEDNVIRGQHVGVDTTGSLVYSLAGRLIATVGIANLVVIDTGDVVLVSSRERAQAVKELLLKLKAKKRYRRYL